MQVFFISDRVAKMSGKKENGAQIASKFILSFILFLAAFFTPLFTIIFFMYVHVCVCVCVCFTNNFFGHIRNSCRENVHLFWECLSE